MDNWLHSSTGNTFNLTEMDIVHMYLQLNESQYIYRQFNDKQHLQFNESQYSFRQFNDKHHLQFNRSQYENYLQFNESQYRQFNDEPQWNFLGQMKASPST